MESTKQKMRQIIEYLKSPVEFQDLGCRLRRGVLLYGPPGCGKTLMAKAIAGESGSGFIYKSASEFLEVYVGVRYFPNKRLGPVVYELYLRRQEPMSLVLYSSMK